MRWAVMDVGSHTVRLEIAEGGGGALLPVRTVKWQLRLARHLGPDGRIPEDAVVRVVDAVDAARREAWRRGADALFAFATAVVRDAPNRREVLEAVRSGAGVPLHVLPGCREAALTFLAARRWMGWRAGPMVLLDIGGGTLEVAFGHAGTPDFAVSLPLGAGRMTRTYFAGQDPPPPRAVEAVRREVRHRLRGAADRIRLEAPRTAVAASRTFQQLARLCGAAPEREGPLVHRRLAREDLRRAVERLARMPAAQRAGLPGISRARAGQSLAGAVVADTLMELMGVESVTVCPWTLREGILLHRLETGDATGWIPADGGGARGAAGGAGPVPPQCVRTT